MDLTLKFFLRTENDGAVEFPVNSGHGQILLSNYKYSATRMGNTPSITGTIKYPISLDSEWSSDVFVEFKGERFFVKNTPSSSYDKSSFLHSYNVELVSEREVLNNIFFVDVVSTSDGTKISEDTEFSFSGTINELATRLNKSLDNSGIGPSQNKFNVTVDEDVIVEDKLFSVSNQTIFEALSSSYEIYNVPYYFSGYNIVFGYAENYIENPIKYGDKDNVLSIAKNNINNDVITKITGYGSDKNIPYYYPNPTPKGYVYLDSSSSSASFKIENMKKFSSNMDLNNPLVYHKVAATITSMQYQYKGEGSPNTITEKSEINVTVGDTDSLIINFKVTDAGIIHVKVIFDAINISQQSIRSFYTSSTLSNGAGTYYYNYLDGDSINCGTLDKGNYILNIKLTYSYIGYNNYTVCISPEISNYEYWKYKNKKKEYHLSDFSIVITDGTPTVGDTLTQCLEKRINVQGKLVPTIYRNSNGYERWITATTDEYENKYSINNQKEYIHTDDTIFPTITNVVNGDGERIDTFIEIAFDENDNNDIYPEGHKYAGKYKHPYFFVKLRKTDGDDYGFNLFEQAIEGSPMSVSFTSGNNASCQFNIAVDESSMKNTVQVDENGNLLRDEEGNVLCNRSEQPKKQIQDIQQDTSKNEVWIALEKEDSTMGVMMPDYVSNIIPSSNDTFILLGISLPDKYYFDAENKLENTLKEYMRENNMYRYSYSAKLSSIFLAENKKFSESLNENSCVSVDYNGDVVGPLFVQSYSMSVKEGSCLPAVEVSISDEIKLVQSKNKKLQQALKQVKTKAIHTSTNAIAARNQASRASAKTTNIERRVEALEKNQSNVVVDELRADVDRNTQNIESNTSRIANLEEQSGTPGADFDEVKEWVEETLESYAKMPTEQPVQDSILIYDSSNQTFKGSDVQISTTVQDIENGEDSKIPTCGQVLEYVDDSVLDKQDTLISGKNIKTVFGQSILGSGDITIDGGGVVDFANDLTGVVEATPEMFTCRPSAGDKSVRDESAVIRRIKGNTIVWGQLADISASFSNSGNRYIITRNDDGSVSIKRDPSITSGYWCAYNMDKSYRDSSHKYMFYANVTVSGVQSSADYCRISVYNLAVMVGNHTEYRTNGRHTFCCFGSPDSSTTWQYAFYVYGVSELTIHNLQAFDLTEMFGAGNEPTTYEEFRQYYPDAYYPYCAPEIRSMRATGIETIGFNAFSGEYAEVIGGQAYYLRGAIDTAHFATEIGGELKEITIAEDRLYTPSDNGYIYATGSAICINLSHSGVRNGEYEPYEKNTLLLPEIAKYFSNGMHGIGDVFDEINEEMAIQRCAVRAYEEGDESNAEVKTDKITTVYKLAEPIYTPIEEPLQLDYKVDDFGTEKMLSNAPSSPFKADIVYQFNAEGRIRDNSRNIERLENKIRDITNVTTRVALQRMILDSTVTSLLPNVVYEGGQYPNIEIPPLQVGKVSMRNVWKVFVEVQDGNINFPFNVKWKDGVAPTYSGYQYVELTFFDNIFGEIYGEWKIYK